MAVPDLKSLLALDLETRLALVQELWDSIVRDAPAGTDLPPTQRERDVIDERLGEDDRDPDGAIPWSEARARLLLSR